VLVVPNVVPPSPRENRRRPYNGLKISQFQVHRRKTAVAPGLLVEPPEIRSALKPRRGITGIVGVVKR